MLDLISEEELAWVLVFLDVATLLEAPAVSRVLAAASGRFEPMLWRRPLQAALARDATALGSDGLPWAPPELRAGCLGAKEEVRVRAFLAAWELPSLPDALRRAADYDQRALVGLLLKAGADPNVCADSGAHGVGFTQVGAFPLHLAAKRSCLEVLDALLAAAADVNAADQNGRTGLMVACASGQAPATEWLLAHGAEIDVSSHYGYTALHYAALLPRFEIVDMLLGASASPTLLDREGQTPLHVVLQSVKRRVEVRQDTSLDPSGHGDEYCYDLNVSHGYNHNPEQDAEHDLEVKRTVGSLLGHGAELLARDERGRSAFDILDAKRRPDLRAWLEALQPPASPGGAAPDAEEAPAPKEAATGGAPRPQETSRVPRPAEVPRPADALGWALSRLLPCCSVGPRG